jgi:hypothetical protein
MKSLLTAVFMLSASTALANDHILYSGNDILPVCKQSPRMADFYVAGVLDSLATTNTMTRYGICLSSGMSNQQVREVVCTHLEKSVAKRHFTAANLAIQALAEAFPCKK